MKWNRKQVAWSAFLAILVLGMALVGSYRTFFGISAGHLEADARKSQHIDEQWSVVSAVDDHLAGLLFYDETKADFVFSVYINRPGVSFGYDFRSGGSIGEIMRSVKAYDYQTSCLLLSMNMPQAAVIVLNEGMENETAVEIDPNEPFAYVLPEGTETLVLYDRQGQMVPLGSVEIF